METVIEYVQANHLKAAADIIGYSLATDDTAYFQWIKDQQTKGIEFCLHGYSRDWQRIVCGV